MAEGDMAEDRAPEAPQVSFLKRIASRVGMKLTLVLATVLILVEAIVLVPSYFGLRSDLLAQVRAEAVTALSATLKAEMAMHEGMVTDVGQFLAKEGFLRGGVLYDIAGDERGAFGERPRFDLPRVEAGESGALIDGGAIYEFFIPHEETGLVFDAIVSVEARGVGERLTEFLINVGLIVLFLAVTCICGIAVAIDAVVLKRILGLRWAVIQAENRPDVADRFAVRDGTGDEVGDLGRSLDRLLYTVSNTYQEDLAVALAITEQSSIATLIYSPGGDLVGANAAAHRLFEVADTEALKARDPKLLAVGEAGPDTPMTRLEAGPFSEKGHAITPSGWVPCVVAGQTIARGDGSVLRHVATLIDLSEQERRFQDEHRLRMASEDRIEELRASLAACLALLPSSPVEGPSEDIDYHRVLPDRLVGDWTRDHTRDGRMNREDVSHGVLPPITVPRGVADDLFRNALSLALMRVGGRGRIKVDAEKSGDDRFDFIFKATPKTLVVADAGVGAEAGVVSSAVRLLAARAGGTATIPDTNAGDGGFTMRITLSDKQDQEKAA